VVWPWSRKPRATYSISDPLLIELFNVGQRNYAGVPVNEQTALGLSATWRAVSLISQTIASLPMRTVRDRPDGTRQRISSFLDNPGTADGPTPFEWHEQVMLHLLLHGNAYLAHIVNGAGGMAGLIPIHPLGMRPEWETDANGKRTGRKVFTANLDDGRQRTFTQATMTQIMGLSLDGLRGLSPITIARNSLGTAIAGDRAAAKLFGNGALISGMVTPEEDVTVDEAKQIKADLNAKVSGDIAVINRKLKFTPWTMTAEDAQFLGSRQFSVEEQARWWGVPPHALMQTEKQTSWGTGVAEQNRGLSRTVLAPWTTRVDQRLSRLLPSKQFAERDFAGLERGAPEQEIELLIKQVDAGLLTLNEARRIRNLPPVEGGDELRKAPAATPPDPEPEPDEPEVAA
jgi:HK97 family phage portal protein